MAFGVGTAAPNPDERRDTRVFLGLATLPLSFLAESLGERRAITRGWTTGATKGRGEQDGPAPGAGVGGSSASICSTSQERFSSRSFSRSALGLNQR